MKRLMMMAVLGVAVGCGVSRPIEGRQDPYGSAQINLASEDLRTHTAIGAPLLSRDQAGMLHVMVPIRAATDLRLYVDYRLSFFDRDDNLLYQTGWMTKVLEPNVPDQIVSNSTTARATDFRMDLRYAK